MVRTWVTDTGNWELELETPGSAEKNDRFSANGPHLLPDFDPSRMIELSPNSIFVLNPEGNITYGNLAFHELACPAFLGLSPEKVLKGWSSLCMSEEGNRGLPVENLTNRLCQLTGSNGETGFFRVLVVPVSGTPGRSPSHGVILVNLSREYRQTDEISHLASNLQAIFEASSDPIVYLDRQKRLTHFNSFFAGFISSTLHREVRTGDSPLDYVHDPNLRALLDEQLNRALLGERILDYQAVLDAEKDVFVFSANINPVWDANGKVEGVSVICRDITESYIAEQALRESEGRFRLVTNQVGIGLFMLDPEKKLVWSNASMTGMLNLTRSELSGDGFLSLLTQDQRHTLFGEMDLGNAAGHQSEFRVDETKNGQKFFKISLARVNEGHGFKGYVGSLEETTELHYATKDAFQFFSLAQDIILKLSLEGEILQVNPAALALLGIPAEALVGKNIQEFTHPDDLPENIPSDMWWDNQIHHRIDFRARVRTNSGEYRWIDWTATLLPDTRLIYASGRDVTDSMREHHRLLMLESVVTHSNDGILIVETHDSTPARHQIRFVNEAMCGITGLNQQELIGQNPVVFLKNGIDDNTARLLIQSFDRNESINIEVSGQRPDGSQYWVDLFIYPVNDEQGFPLHVIVVAHDITFRKQFVQELRRAESYQRTILENSIQNVLLFNLEERVLIFNQRVDKEFFRSYGTRLKVGCCLKDVAPPETMGMLRAVKQQVLDEGGADFIYKKEFADQPTEWHQFHATAAKDDRGEVFGIIISSNDITDIHLANQELIRLSNRLELAIRAGGIGVWELDLSAWVFFGDAISRNIYRLEPGVVRVTFDHWKSLVHPDDLPALEAYLLEMIPKKEDIFYTFRVQSPDQGWIYIQSMASYFEGENGHPGRYIGVNRDVTEEVTAQNELLRAKEMAEEMTRLKTNFLANMSHEIRTPMNGIMGLMELLGEEDDPELRKNYLLMMQKSGKRLLSTLTGILELARMEAEKTEYSLKVISAESLLRSVHESLTPMAVTRKIGFELVPGPENVYILGDERMLDQVLTNIVGNALKFTSSGMVWATWERTKGKRNLSMITISVHDTGIGMDPDQVEKIFQPFQQVSQGRDRKFEGAGLGLAIAKKYTELLGGSITVETQLTKGSTFKVLLPEYALNHL